MKIVKVIVLGVINTLIFEGTVSAENNYLKGKKFGFGIDRDFGVAGTVGKINGFLGNKGVSIDNIFKKKTLKIEVNEPVFWFIGVGGYGDWDGDFGVRLPVGAEWYFQKNLDAFAQLIPNLQIAKKPKFGLSFGFGIRYQF